MCGRVTLTLSIEEVAKILNLKDEIDWTPRYNIAPLQPIPVVVNADKMQLKLFQWGLIPFWAKKKDIAGKLFNARAETVDIKPTFRHCFQKQRCMILADGFYEWKKEGKSRIPYRFTLSHRKLFGFAGVYDSWISPEGSEIQSCTIITTSSNELISPIHNRMPVILQQASEEIWLDPNFKDFMYLKSMLKPYPAELMQNYQVSAIVNSARNDTIECIRPVIKQESLFTKNSH